MTPTSTSSDGVWPCPFRGFHCCPDGEVGNKGFPRLISHLKRLHLPSDERKGVLRETISTDHGLYMAVEETLKVFNQWLCGKCMDLHAVSRACHHPDGLVRFSKGSDDMSGYIVGISKPSNKESGTEITEGLVLDAELLDRVYRPKNRQERRSGNRKSLQQSSILKSLAMWGKDDGITTLVKSILDGSALGSFGQGGGDFLEEGTTGNTNIKQCLRKVADGHFTAAVKVLSSSGVAPYCDDTIKALEAKHPYKPPPSMPSITFSEPPLVAEIDSVFSCVKSFPKNKPDYDFAVGTIWRCLVSKVSMKGVGKEISKYLSDFQFEVGVSGGAEAIVHSVNQVLSEYHNDGVQQGDLLGHLIFALILRPLLHKFKDSCKLLLHDGTVIGDSKEVARVLDIIKVSGPVLGLELNIKKTKIFWPSCNVASSYAFVASRAQSWVLQDHILRNSDICGMDDDYVCALACLRDTIPSFDFCIFTNKDTAPSKSQQTLASALFSEMVKDMKVHFDMTVRQKAVFECLRAPHAQDFLLAIPIDGLGQHMSPACLDSFGEHAVHCKELPGFKYRHDMVRDVLFDICRRAWISAKKDAPVNFLTDPSDGRSTLRPADVLIFGWVGGKHACVDLTGVSPLVRLSSQGFTVGQTALKAA
ncbi:hypothetical protein Tco_0920083 [Tanacetum coccineum]